MSTAIAIGSKTLQLPDTGESYSVALINQNNQNIADEVNAANLLWGKQAKGEVLYGDYTSNSGAISDAIISAIPTFTFKAGRKYKIVWDTSYIISDTTSLFYLCINTCSTADAFALLTGMVQQQGRTIAGAVAGSTNYQGSVVWYYNPSVDLTTQVKFRAIRAAGGGTIVIKGATDERQVYYIEDCGAQF